MLFSRVLRIGVLCGLGIFISSCGSTVNLREPTPLPALDEPTMQVNTLWKRAIPYGANPLSAYVCPAVNPSRSELYLVSGDGHFFALNDTDGEITFTLDLAQNVDGTKDGKRSEELFATTVTLGSDGLVYVPSLKGHVYVIDPIAQAVVSVVNTHQAVENAPVITPTHLIVQSVNDSIFAYGLTDYQLDWQFNQIASSNLSLRGQMPMFYSRGALFVGLSDGRIILLDGDTGQLLWQKYLRELNVSPLSVSLDSQSESVLQLSSSNSALNTAADVDAALVFDNQKLYASSAHGITTALSLESLESLWSVNIFSTTAPVLSSDALILADVYSQIYALDKDTGALLWTNMDYRFRNVSDLMLVDNGVSALLVFADALGYVHVLDAEDGTYLARDKITPRALGSCTLNSAGQLYVWDDIGYLFALDIGIIQ